MKREPSHVKPRRLKPEQAAAAHTLDCHLSVTAGPGSGKTFVLVERYLEILRTRKVSVDNIVAITFTNRAANEMRQRVRHKIDALLQETSGSERQTWLRHKRALEGAVITTIHGFCSRLLHEFPVEANIDPQFMLLDEHQAAMLLEAVVEEALADAIHHGNEKIIQLAQGTGRATLAAALVELHRKYRGEGLSVEAIEKLSSANHAARSDYVAALKELDAHMMVLLSAGKLSKVAAEKRDRAALEWPRLRSILAQPPTEKSIAIYCQAIEDFRETRLNKNNHPVVERLDEALWGTDSSTSERLRGRVPSLGFDLLAKDYALALLQILREIDRRLDNEKQRLSVLDFDDLQLRALKLLELPEVVSRGTERYQFFLIDEFQDTNSLQRDFLTRLALIPGANLFIVGDRKQSIYGFRGADVDVFSEMTAAIENGGGSQQPLHLNFRSQQPLIDCFNFLFARIFQARSEVPEASLGQLGYVHHEPSQAERGAEHEPPLVELLVSAAPESSSPTANSENENDEERDPLGAQERDAEQIAARISALVGGTDSNLWNQVASDSSSGHFKYGDVAILLRAFTGLWTYESALRRAGIPYLTVQGKGFYQREEITDLIQLLRFLDNTTDELALAAVLRSPLGGISDNALLALRCAPLVGESIDSERLPRRNLLRALRRHREIQFIDGDDHTALDRIEVLLGALIPRRNRYGIAELLRYAVSESEFTTVIAANFDGAQRVANVEKLFRLAEQFDKSGHLIRDFVRFVEEFEALGGREGEGQMDESANVVRLMTIHQAKGLEFPIVIIPDLHRDPARRETQFILDRHKGMTARIPDGRGQTVRGALFNELRQRNRWREEFESMRLLYVAATRARDRLIFSGALAGKDLKNLTKTNREQWLAWIWQALELDEFAESGVLKFGDDVQIQVTVDRECLSLWSSGSSAPAIVPQESEREAIDLSRPFTELFPLLSDLPPEPGQVLRRFSVTQLINFQRCARQYYFDRTLKAPGKEERAVWNDAEAPEPPANLTATLKGAVIHRFCETYIEGDNAETRLRTSFEDVLAQRQTELAGRAFQIDPQQAVRDLLPLAKNYLASDVFQRVTAAQRFTAESADPKFEIRNPQSSSPGLWSELRFRLRRPQGILTGTIDKLLITPSASGAGFDVEIIDFKTNRFRSTAKPVAKPRQTAAATAMLLPARSDVAFRAEIKSQPAQAFFNFETVEAEVPSHVPTTGDVSLSEPELSIGEQAKAVAHDYQLQMQSYALALRELFGVSIGSGPGSPSGQPAWGGGCDRVKGSDESSLAEGLKINSLRATLHFIDPNIEISLPASLLEQKTCASAIDDAMLSIAALDGTLEADLFPPLPATHCRICNFLELCPAGHDWLQQN
jgi:ATP-dependent helicase/nuclease subunit A